MITKAIKKDIIYENKIYNINKAIKALNSILDNYINAGLFKTKIIFVVSKNISPAEEYCFNNVFGSLHNINYSTCYIESLIEDYKEIILLENMLYTKNNSINICNIDNIKDTLKGKKFILLGNSTVYDNTIKKLTSILKKEIYQYENKETILFERV